MGFHASRRSGVLLAAAVLLLPTLPLSAQVPEATTAALKQIFASRTYAPERFGPARWIEGGKAYTILEKSEGTKGGFDIVRYDSKTGARSILIAAASFVPAGDTVPLPVDDYVWSSPTPSGSGARTPGATTGCSIPIPGPCASWAARAPPPPR